MQERDIYRGSAPNSFQVEALQRFNNKNIVLSDLTHMDTSRSIAELIDNGLDDGCKKVVVTFNPYPNTSRTPGLTVEYYGGNGMNSDVLREYVQWAEIKQTPGLIKQWGRGGKLALLYWLGQEDGSVYISSTPNTGGRFNLEIENWWQTLKQDHVYKINGDFNTTAPQDSRTIFELINIDRAKIPSNKQIIELANNLGLTYGNLISSGKLELVLRRFGAGGKLEGLTVKPIRINFVDDQDNDYKSVKVQTKNGPVTLNLAWGHIDIEKKNEDLKERTAVYKGISKLQDDKLEQYEQLSGGIYIYNYGRLVGVYPLKKLGLSRTTSVSFQNFAISANVVSGWLELDLLKTELSLSARSTSQLFPRIAREVRSTMTEIAKRSDSSSSVSKKERKYFKELEDNFGKALLRMFSNKNQIAKTFGISTGIYNAPNQTKNDGTKLAENIHVPGSRTSGGQITINERNGQRNTERSVNIENPIPKFEIRPDMPNFYPSVELEFTSDGETLIVFNKNHPAIKRAAESKNPNSAMLLTMLAARCFFHQKWVKESGGDAEKYAIGMDEDIARFLRFYELNS